MLDSKASLASLGKQPTQIVQMYTQVGGITVNDSSFSHMKVTFTNGTTTYVVYDESMGTIQYELGDNKIAYEGGGVFRKYHSEDDPVMITPPEFHYNGETLTLPIIRINSNESVGGTGVITLRLVSDQTSYVLFPNPHNNPEFTNPLLLGKQVNLVIKSDYYKAWAKYIEERTEAMVTTNDVTKETTVTLNAKPNDQSQNLIPPIDIYGFNVANESALINFSMLFGDGASNFDFLLTSSTTETKPYFEFNAKKSGGNGTSGVTITLNYFDTPGTETWQWDVQGLKVGNDFDVDFLNNNISVAYKSSTQSWTWANETNCSGNYTNGDTILCGGRKVFQHYMSIVGPSFSLTPGNQPGDPAYPSGFNPANSTYVLYYEVMPPVITYLHIVQHKMQAYTK